MTMSPHSDVPARLAFTRHPADVPVTLAPVPDGSPITGRATNLSREGLFVATDTTFPVGAVVRLALALPVPDGPRTLVALAEVRWVNAGPEPRSATHPVGLGLALVRLDDANRRLLEAFLEARGALPTARHRTVSPPGGNGGTDGGSHR